MLLTAGNRLSAPQPARLRAVLASDDPTGEIGAAWAVKDKQTKRVACGFRNMDNYQRRIMPHIAVTRTRPAAAA